MAKRELFLVIDIGSTAIHMAEFESMPDNSLILHAFDNLEYNEALSDDNRQDMVAATVRRGLATGKYRAKVASITISGQAAFTRRPRSLRDQGCHIKRTARTFQRLEVPETAERP